MKFKVGDKVIVREFSFESSGVIFNSDMRKMLDKEYLIEGVRKYKDQYLYLIKEWEWVESALELAEPQEYFYVGQTVYSPLFDNAERNAIITSVSNNETYPIVCEGENIFLCFTLDGKRRLSDNFVSLFQEPIQFPVNKPIERFEEGEIVEVSNNGEFWKLCRYIGSSEDKLLPYKVYTVKDDKELQHSIENYAKIRKIK